MDRRLSARLLALLGLIQTLICLAAAVPTPTKHALGPYKIDPAKLTVGGLSAGAAMAIQYHVAFSSEVKGCAAFAGAPYDCAGGVKHTALTSCMHPDELHPVPSVAELAAATEAAAVSGHIDSPTQLASAHVFLYSGALDTVVAREVITDTLAYYEHFVSPAAGGEVVTSFDVQSEHMYPTLSEGEPCEDLGSPYIGKCDYDGAGAALATLYGPALAPRGTAVAGNLLAWNQTDFVANPGAISLGDVGFVYVPTSCRSLSVSCGLHIALHGCTQSLSDIGMDFPKMVGLNDWAETNDLIILYPQLIRSAAVGDKMGCWDWWGYTGAEYLYQSGAQMAFIHSVQQYVMGTR